MGQRKEIFGEKNCLSKATEVRKVQANLASLPAPFLVLRSRALLPLQAAEP